MQRTSDFFENKFHLDISPMFDLQEPSNQQDPLNTYNNSINLDNFNFLKCNETIYHNCDNIDKEYSLSKHS